MPTRLERIEDEVIALTRRVRWVESELAEIKGRVAKIESDVSDLKVDVSDLKVDVSDLKVDVGDLKGDSLEFKLPRRVRPLLSHRLGLRRTRIMQSLLMPESVGRTQRPCE